MLGLGKTLLAQEPAELLTRLQGTKADTSKVNVLNKLAEAYLNINSDSAKLFAEQAVSLAEGLGYRVGLAAAWTNIGQGHLLAEEYPMALSFFNRAMSIWEALGNQEEQANTHGKLGYAAMQQSNLPEALQHYLEKMRWLERSGDQRAIAELTSTIGNVYAMMTNWDEAIKQQKEAIRIYTSLGDSLGIARTSNNLGSVYDGSGNFDEGLKYIEQALRIVQALDQPMGIAICLGSLGIHYHRAGNYSEALRYNLEAIPLLEQLGLRYESAGTHINVGEMLTKLGRYPEAKTYLDQGLKFSRQIGAKQWIANAYHNLSEMERAQGNYQEALEHYQQYVVYQDSITNDANTRKAVQVQMQYEFDKKEAETRAIQERKDQQQRLMRNSIGGGLAFALLFLGVVWRQRNRISKEKQRSEELLLNILPDEVARELKEKGHSDAQLIDQVTVLFTDFKGFTAISEKVTPKELVKDLHECFSAFDRICEKYGIEKIKTIGDAYMAAGGLPVPNNTHVADVVSAALEMIAVIEAGKAQKVQSGQPFFEVRIGIHTGPVVAGIVGVKKFQYDIWGDTVNIASRMESSGEPGKVNLSQNTYELLKADSRFVFEPRGQLAVKGKGELDMYFVRAVVVSGNLG